MPRLNKLHVRLMTSQDTIDAITAWKGSRFLWVVAQFGNEAPKDQPVLLLVPVQTVLHGEQTARLIAATACQFVWGATPEES